MNKENTRDVVVSAEGITKIYKQGGRSLSVLKGSHLSIKRGAAVAIVGASGSGKSTLLHILGGLDRPDKGEVKILGQALGQLSDEEVARLRGRHIGFVFQFHYLLAELSALDNILLPAQIQGLRQDLALARAKELLHFLGLSQRAHHYPSQLSGGERQRVAIGRALISKPDILIADEPTGSLDSESSQMVRELLFSLHKSLGLTMLVVTHNEKLTSHFQHRLHLNQGLLSLI